jgi:hypothetical protein
VRQEEIVDILNEIEWFLSSPQNIGALLLSGKWGSGKTYYLEHDVKKNFEDKYKIQRISLFGMNSAAELHNAVKKAYFMLEMHISKSIDKSSNRLNVIKDKIADITENIPIYGSALNAVLTLDWHEFVAIKNKVNGIPFVLIFDDLERISSDKNTVLEILGCINDYVETIGIKTILVANEEKIVDLNYKEIKEKLIFHTIKLIPDYTKIVSSIIHEYDESSDKRYYQFISANRDQLIDIFSSEGYDNIRSLRVIIQGFKRIFNLISDRDLSNVKEKTSEFYLMFARIIFAYKTGKLETKFYEELGDFDTVYWDSIDRPTLTTEERNRRKELCHLCTNTFFVKGIADWIIDGVWSEQDIINELYLINDKLTTWHRNPKNIILSDFMSATDSELDEYYPQILDDAYSGKLTLNDYIHLLSNIYQAKNFDVSLPIDIDCATSGLQIRLKKIELGEIVADKVTTYLFDRDLDNMSEKEKEFYKTIKNFNAELVSNKIEFIKQLNNEGLSALYQFSNKELPSFDMEMKKSFFSAYQNAFNHSRWIAINELIEMIEHNVSQIRGVTRFNLEETIQSLYSLINDFNSIIAAPNKLTKGIINKSIDKLNCCITNLRNCESKMTSNK